jgi:hypothetical protein
MLSAETILSPLCGCEAGQKEKTHAARYCGAVSILWQRQADGTTSNSTSASAATAHSHVDGYRRLASGKSKSVKSKPCAPSIFDARFSFSQIGFTPITQLPRFFPGNDAPDLCINMSTDLLKPIVNPIDRHMRV